jgi:hypothetical protein
MATKRSKDNNISMPNAAGAAPARRKSAATPRPKHGIQRSAAAPVTGTIVEVVAAETGYAPACNEIAALAYTYWADRGRQGGSPEEDWLRAERELRAKASA